MSNAEPVVLVHGGTPPRRAAIAGALTTAMPHALVRRSATAAEAMKAFAAGRVVFVILVDGAEGATGWPAHEILCAAPTDAPEDIATRVVSALAPHH